MTTVDANAHKDALLGARARLDLSLAAIANVHQSQRQHMLAWFDTMVRGTLGAVAPVDISVVTPWLRARACWRVITSRHVIEPALVEYLRGVLKGERYAAITAVLRRLGEDEGDVRLGAWLETSNHGMEAGFFRRGVIAIERALGFWPEGHDRLAVDVWAKEYGIDHAVCVTQSAHPSNPWTELVLPLPGSEHLDQLVAARVLFRALDMPVPDDLTYAGILRVATAPLVFVLGLSRSGPMRIGMSVHVPRPDAMRALDDQGQESASRSAAQGMAALQLALGPPRPPTTITWVRDATGVSRELCFAVDPEARSWPAERLASDSSSS